MRAELLTIGSELLNGATVNTNAAYLARRLTDAGITCHRQTAVADARAEITQAIREAASRSDLVILTGGLGPTCDDVTMAAIAEAVGRPLRLRGAAAFGVRRFYARRHRRVRRAAMRQARVPEGADVLPNALGTAPGVWLNLGSQVLVALPGVPGEMRAMLDASVLPRLRTLAGRDAITSVTVQTAGLVELEIQAALQRAGLPRQVELGLYPHLRLVDVRLTIRGEAPATARRHLETISRRLRRTLGNAVYGAGSETLESAVGRLLAGRRQQLALAESCTGGLVAHRITAVPGSSRYFRGGVVAYHNQIKERLLGVHAAVLARHGAVSAPAARAMARGVRGQTQADIGLAITGIAGPSGGSAKKPVGLVVFGLSDACGTVSRQMRFFGDRASIKAQAAQTALNWLRLHLLSRAHASR